MPKREEFIEVINTFKTVSPSITDIQRRGLLKQAVQNYDLSVEEASEILKSLGMIVGEEVNYFEALGVSVEQIQEFDEQTIVKVVESAHDRCYRESLRAGARVRPDGKTEEQWRNILNQARDTLVDTQKRQEYLATFLIQEDLQEVVPDESPQPETEFQEEESTPSDTPEPTGSNNEADIILVDNQVFQLPLTPDPTIPSNETDLTPMSDLETVSSVDLTSVPPDMDVPTDMMFIPAGEFQMGSHGEEENGDEMTTHTVYLGAFFIDKYPVTNSQYQLFLDANPEWQKRRIVEVHHNGNYLRTWNGNNYPKGKADNPVVDVSWYAAMAYALWAEKRLPMEAEWEKAARGGQIGKKYPWGDHIDINMANYGMHVGKTTPVGQYSPNEFGIYDVAGNVWEWCLDEYDDEGNSSRQISGLAANRVSEITHNYLSIETSRVLRGGSWASSERATRVAYCGWAAPNFTYYSYGFRCVKDINL